MPLPSDSLYDAIIIGAGISGLVVASILSDAGYKVCVLATPIEGRLFFAGEATCFDGDHATVHGAIESAERCAREALLSLDT